MCDHSNESLYRSVFSCASGLFVKFTERFESLVYIRIITSLQQLLELLLKFPIFYINIVIVVKGILLFKTQIISSAF